MNHLLTSTDPSQVQLTADGRLKHFLTTEGLSRELLTEILDTADSFISTQERDVTKVPLLRGKTVVNLFFENSTRTRSTFELAAKPLAAGLLTLEIAKSAAAQGQPLWDTLWHLEAMYSDMFVVRHADSGAADFMAEHVTPIVAMTTAGDG